MAANLRTPTGTALPCLLELLGVARPCRASSPRSPGVRAPLRRDHLRAVRQDLREEPRPLDAQPPGRLQKRGCRRSKRCGAEDPLKGAGAPSREGQRVGPDQRPLAGALPGPSGHPAGRPAGPRAGGYRPPRPRPGGAPRLLRHPPSRSTTTTSCSAPRAAPWTSSTRGPPDGTARRRSTIPAASSRPAACTSLEKFAD
jgi:hypothetical protein